MTPHDALFPVTIPLKAMDSAMLLLTLTAKYDSVTVAKAAEMAAFLHRDQTRFIRKGMPVVPYIEHPLRVAIRISRWGYAATDILCAALLHDAVEDCAAEIVEHYGRDGEDAFDVIARLFGERAAALVRLVTNEDGITHDGYVEKVCRLAADAESAHIAYIALVLKASDLKDNAGSLKHQTGRGDDARMIRRARKYLPVLPYVIHGLRDDVFVADELRVLLRDLHDIVGAAA